MEKMFDVVCISVFNVVCISIFNVAYRFKISWPKYLFLWCLFWTIKWVQKGVYRKRGVFFTMRLIEIVPGCSMIYCSCRIYVCLSLTYKISAVWLVEKSTILTLLNFRPQCCTLCQTTTTTTKFNFPGAKNFVN